MAVHGSMTTGELIRIIQRCARGPIQAFSKDNGMVGVYMAGEHILGLSKTGDLPERNIRNHDDVMVVRGWKDSLAKLYKDGLLRKNKELVRLMGRAALDYIDRTGSPLLPQGLGASWQSHGEHVKADWLPR